MNKKDVLNYIENHKSIYVLQEIRAKVNKKLYSFKNINNYNPFESLDIDKKRKIIKDLFLQRGENENI